MASSDDKTTSQPVGRFANAGKRSINDIIHHAMEDKISSKKKVKDLTFSLGRPQAQYSRALWTNRLNAFRTATLGHDLSAPPSGEDIERFLSIIFDKLKTHSPHWVPSFALAQKAFKEIVQSLIFDHPYFILSPHESLRITTLIDSLVKRGDLRRNLVESLTG